MAISNAFFVDTAFISPQTSYPIISFEPASVTRCRYSFPATVCRYVISETHSCSGMVSSRSLVRLGYFLIQCFESVVLVYLRFRWTSRCCDLNIPKSLSRPTHMFLRDMLSRNITCSLRTPVRGSLCRMFRTISLISCSATVFFELLDLAL